MTKYNVTIDFNGYAIIAVEAEKDAQHAAEEIFGIEHVDVTDLDFTGVEVEKVEEDEE